MRGDGWRCQELCRGDETKQMHQRPWMGHQSPHCAHQRDRTQSEATGAVAVKHCWRRVWVGAWSLVWTVGEPTTVARRSCVAGHRVVRVVNVLHAVLQLSHLLLRLSRKEVVEEVGVHGRDDRQVARAFQRTVQGS